MKKQKKTIFAGMKRQVLIGFLLLLALSACHSPQREARRMVARAERLFDTLPDSTASLIDSVLRMPVYFNEKRRMDMALLQAEALLGDRGQEIPPLMDDDFFDDKPFFSTSPELERAAEYYAKKKQYAKAAHAALYSGFVQQHYNDKAAAMQSYKDAEHYGKMAEDSLDVALAKYRIGSMLYYDGTYQEALALLKNAEIAFNNHTIESSIIQNKIAVCYLVLGDYENAERSFQQNLICAKKNHIDKVKLKVLNNYAVLYRIQGQYEQAIQCLKQIEVDTSLDMKERLMISLNLGNVFFDERKMDSANYYYKRMEAMLPATKVKLETQLAAYDALYKFATSQGNDSMALQYRGKHENLLYEIMLQRQEQNVYRIQRQYDYETIQNTLNRKIIQRHNIILIISSLLSISYVIILILQYRHKRMMEAYHQLQIEFEAASQQAQQAHQVLQQRVMELYRSGQEDRLERILSEFTTAYPQGIEKLQANHPDLTETECHIVVLSFLGFRVKEEAELLNLSANTVGKYRTNIRKKVGSDPVSNLFR